MAVGVSVAVIGILTFWGAWTRRWISDDGLIVLRTVRNLIAGNGPVFNVGERVEANTSTLWQYLIYAGERVSGARLEYVAMALAISASVAAMMLGTWASARAYGSRHQQKGTILLPAGALIYLALPPARDFFTSGLEWGLAIFYLASLWALLVEFARYRGTQKTPTWATFTLAFWAGLSWLVRPELALYGAVVGILLLAAYRSPRAWLGIVACALPVPAGYEIFRMGYYGLLTPHTAVAKSAADAAWASGFAYLRDFNSPYVLWLPLVAVIIAALAALAGAINAHASAVQQRVEQGVQQEIYNGARQPAHRKWLFASISVMLLCGLIHVVYVLRVGGDFMHARMLLLPLFALLLPAFVLPASVRTGQGIAVAVASAVIAVWALVIVLRGHRIDWKMFEGEISIVDERTFWTYATDRPDGDPPKVTEDFAGFTFLTGYHDALADLEATDDALATNYRTNAGNSPKTATYNWMTVQREQGNIEPPTLYFINLGMMSMDAPLNVRVLDSVGLATPLAARQPREEGGRIGHDKQLGLAWQAAYSGADLDQLPGWYDIEEAKLAREALQQPQFQELFATYRDPLTMQRIWENIKWSLGKGKTLAFSSDPHDYVR